MKNFLGGLIAVLVLGYLGTLVAWWGLALVAAFVGFALQEQGGWSFLSGFLGGALFFGAYAYYLDSANEGQLSSMMQEILPFNPFWPTVVLGGLLGGLGMLVGKYTRDVVLGEKKIPKYRGKYR
jgi:hypothetical protein